MTLKDRYKEFASDTIYHVYNRGVAKNDIFLSEDDYINYIIRMNKFYSYDWTLLCYALMPNHIHFIIKQNTEVPISEFIKSLHTSYVYYFNKKYDRVGPLFQDRFKARIVESDEYLVHLSRYIHLNPLINKYVKDIKDYRWSSYLDCIGERSGKLCHKDIILNIISNQGTVPGVNRGLSPSVRYEKFVMDGIKYAEELKNAKEIAKLVDNCL